MTRYLMDKLKEKLAKYENYLHNGYDERGWKLDAEATQTCKNTIDLMKRLIALEQERQQV